jgi:putative Mg2+ transporter-C (MgtC) family protein
MTLELMGILERRGNLKGYSRIYEARGHDQTLMLTSILDAMDRCKERLTNVERDAIGDVQRVAFVLTATTKRHAELKAQLKAAPAIEALHTFHDPEED